MLSPRALRPSVLEEGCNVRRTQCGVCVGGGRLSRVSFHFKPGSTLSICFPKIMLERDPRRFSLTPVAQPVLLRIRINLSCVPPSGVAAAASLPDLGHSSGWSPGPARVSVLGPWPSSRGLEPVAKATSTGHLVCKLRSCPAHRAGRR